MRTIELPTIVWEKFWLGGLCICMKNKLKSIFLISTFPKLILTKSIKLLSSPTVHFNQFMKAKLALRQLLLVMLFINNMSFEEIQYLLNSC